MDRCPHHWIIETAAGPTSEGTCLLCSATKDFANSVEADSDWGTQVTSDMQEAKGRKGSMEEYILVTQGVDGGEHIETKIKDSEVVIDKKGQIIDRLFARLPAEPSKAQWLRDNRADMVALMDLVGVSQAAREVGIDRGSVENFSKWFRAGSQDVGTPGATREPLKNTSDALEAAAAYLEDDLPLRITHDSPPSVEYLQGKVDAYERVIDRLGVDR